MLSCQWKNLPVAVFLGALASFGQSTDASVDPPGRVARLSLIEGNASALTRATGPDWAPAQVNYSLSSGDQLWTDLDSRAELQLGTAAIRLRPETNFAFNILDDMAVQIHLNSGGLNIHVRNLLEREIFEVDTPNAAFNILKPGDYRIELTGRGTRIIVRSGTAEIAGVDRSLPLRAGDLIEITGDGQLAYSLTSAPAADPFDKWSADRDKQQDQFTSARYVSPDMIGAPELDSHGVWTEDPNLGPVWTPRGVDPDWEPYTYGHWVWMDPYGWVWVDDEPWGYPTTHYGRWITVAGVWVWSPGPPVWAPALVVWVGGGSGGVGAWFPLGPHESYTPAYHASPRYVSRINGPHLSRGNTPYANRNSAVAMNQADMAAGRPARHVITRVNPASPQIVGGAPPAPADHLRTAASSGRVAARPPSDVASRRVFERNPARPASVSPPAPAVLNPPARSVPASAPTVSRPVEAVSGPPTVIGERADGPVRGRRPVDPAQYPQSTPPIVNPNSGTSPATQPSRDPAIFRPTEPRMERAPMPQRTRPIEIPAQTQQQQQQPQPQIQPRVTLPPPSAPVDRGSPVGRAVEPPSSRPPQPAAAPQPATSQPQRAPEPKKDEKKNQ